MTLSVTGSVTWEGHGGIGWCWNCQIKYDGVAMSTSRYAIGLLSACFKDRNIFLDEGICRYPRFLVPFAVNCSPMHGMPETIGNESGGLVWRLRWRWWRWWLMMMFSRSWGTFSGIPMLRNWLICSLLLWVWLLKRVEMRKVYRDLLRVWRHRCWTATPVFCLTPASVATKSHFGGNLVTLGTYLRKLYHTACTFL